MKKFGIVLAIAVVCVVAAGQQVTKRLTNQDVIEMVGMGLSDEVIISKIRRMSAEDHLALDTGVEGLRALKAGKVPDEVIKVMINPVAPPVVASVGGGSGSEVVNANLPPHEVGVYWKNHAAFVPVEGQTLSQAKVGGRAGSMFTYGMRSEHWDATLDGPVSKNRVKERRPEFYLYVPDGTSASDFVLIKLVKKDNRREFQVGSFGGLTAGKSGVKKDKAVPFSFEHVALRTYRLTLENELAPGEYAFFMGTGQQVMMGDKQKSGGAASGRIYDFSVPE